MIKQRGNGFRLALSLAGFVVIVLGSLWLSRSQIDTAVFAPFGYFGVFLATMLGSATMFFPVPNVATVFGAGVLFNPIGVAIFGGIGAAMGEMIGYFVGLGGTPVVRDQKWFPFIERTISHYGWLTIFLLALVPNPLFDLAGLVAGMTRYSIPRFFLATLLGKFLRSLVLAYFGSIA